MVQQFTPTSRGIDAESLPEASQALVRSMTPWAGKTGVQSFGACP